MRMQKKYLLIYEEIAKQIEEGEFPPKTILPSENDFADRYDTSRETIRKALNLLAQNGYIQKIRGKGSLVLDLKRHQFPISGLISFKELAQNMGGRTKTTVEEFMLELAGREIAWELNVADNEKVWKIKRVRHIDEERVILDKDFLVEKHVPGLTRQNCENSIFDYIEKKLEKKISFAKKEFTVEEPSAEDRKFLDMEGFNAIVIVKNYIFFDDATLFQYTESRHRPDKFQFVDFARRMDTQSL